MAQTPKKSKGGPKPKHIPQRTCITCRRTETKRGLLRIVRGPDGRVGLDPSGKRAGRGAYLCHNPACWQQALKRGSLERALRIEALHNEDRAALEAQAQHLAADATASA